MKALSLNNARRSRQVFMSDEDNAALTELLREKIRPIEMIAVDFNEGMVRRIESLVDKTASSIFVTSPEPGDRTIEQLEQVLRYLGPTAPFEEFRMKLPRRQFLYHPRRGFRKVWTRPPDEGGIQIEVTDEAYFHFVYNNQDPMAHAFAEKILRLLNKFLVHEFVTVVASTGSIRLEIRSGSTYWAGYHVIESCRRTPNRYLMCVGETEDGELICLAPMPIAPANCPADRGGA